MDETTTLVHYVPVATTVLSALFCAVLLRRYRFKRRGTHLVWWAFGILCYGIGTALEGSITLFGNSIALTKAWYIAGGLSGGGIRWHRGRSICCCGDGPRIFSRRSAFRSLYLSRSWCWPPRLIRAR